MTSSACCINFWPLSIKLKRQYGPEIWILKEVVSYNGILGNYRGTQTLRDRYSYLFRNRNWEILLPRTAAENSKAPSSERVLQTQLWHKQELHCFRDWIFSYHFYRMLKPDLSTKNMVQKKFCWRWP